MENWENTQPYQLRLPLSEKKTWNTSQDTDAHDKTMLASILVHETFGHQFLHVTEDSSFFRSTRKQDSVKNVFRPLCPEKRNRIKRQQPSHTYFGNCCWGQYLLIPGVTQRFVVATVGADFLTAPYIWSIWLGDQSRRSTWVKQWIPCYMSGSASFKWQRAPFAHSSGAFQFLYWFQRWKTR